MLGLRDPMPHRIDPTLRGLTQLDATSEKWGSPYVRTSSVDSKNYEGEFSGPQSFEIKRRLPYEVFGVGIGVFVTIGLILLLGL